MDETRPITSREELHTAIRAIPAEGVRPPLHFRGDVANKMGRAMNVRLTAERRGTVDNGSAAAVLGAATLVFLATPPGWVITAVTALTGLAGALLGGHWAEQRLASSRQSARDNPFGVEAEILVERGYAIADNIGDQLVLR
jgi:hypothetical protein